MHQEARHFIYALPSPQMIAKANTFMDRLTGFSHELLFFGEGNFLSNGEKDLKLYTQALHHLCLVEYDSMRFYYSIPCSLEAVYGMMMMIS